MSTELKSDNFTLLNEQFHIFSKSPVRSGQLLGAARNKSGHTVTTSDVWSEDIPALFIAYNTKLKDDFAKIASDNDLCYIKQGEIEKLYYYKEEDGWFERTTPLTDLEVLFNSSAAKLNIYNDGTCYLTNERSGVIRYHKDKPANSITDLNNNGQSGNGLTARIKKYDADGNFISYISLFVSSTDKVVQGNPSSLYDPVVVYKGQTLEESSEDTTENKYIANSYAGIIQFHSKLTADDSTGDFNNVTVSVFEYIGKKLNDVLENMETPVVSDSTHDISHKYDNKNNVKSFKDGIITFSDGTTDEVDVQKAVIAKYLFRGNLSSTITEFNKRNEFFNSWYGDTYRNDFYYEYDAFDYDDIYDDDLNSSGKEILSTLQNVINGKSLFLRSRLTTFNDDLSCLMYGFQMFANSKNLEKFRSALPSLTNGIRMFYGCPELTKFETKLPNLVLAECMFAKDTTNPDVENQLEEINTCLPNLTHAQGMFGGCSKLSKLRFSKNSFQCLYNGCDMFNGCSKLGEFYYELPYLETADDMFLGCQLDVKSVRIIAESLYDFGEKGTIPENPDYAEDGRKHVITIGIRKDERDKVTKYVELMDSKGWVVEINEYLGSEPLPPSEPEPEPEPEEPEESESSIFNITEDNPNEEHPYVSDIPAWRNDRYIAYDLKITRIPSNDSRDIGIIIGTVGKNN